MAVSHCLSSGFPVAQVEAHPEGEAEVQVMGIVDHRRQSLTVCFVDSLWLRWKQVQKEGLKAGRRDC